MAKDGTNRGGRRVRAGAKPEALNDKLAAGRPATRLTTPAEPDVFDLDGTDIGDGALLAGEPMPEPGEYLSAEQRDGQPLGADLVYRETWNWHRVRLQTLDRAVRAGVRPLHPVRAGDFQVRSARQTPHHRSCDRQPVRGHIAVVRQAGQRVPVRDLRHRARHLHHRLLRHHARR